MRTKNEARRDLYSVERQITSKEKTAENTTNATTAKICDATLPALYRRAAELRAEIEKLPEGRTMAAPFNLSKFEGVPFGKLSPAQLAELDRDGIPAFLRRAPKPAEVEW